MKWRSGLLVKRQVLSMRVGSGPVGEVPPGEVAEQLLVRRLGLAVHRVRIDLFPAMMIPAELEARDQKAGEPVVAALFHLEVEDREGAQPEMLRARRLEPRQHLPLRHRQTAQLRDQLGGPGTGADDQAPGLVASAGRAHLHPPAVRVPRHHRLPAADLRAVGEGLLDVRDVASLGQQEPTVGLVEAADLPGRRYPG